MSEAVLDTNVWVSVLSGDERARRLREVMGSRKAVVTPIVLAEIASLSAQGRLKDDGMSAILGTARVEPLTIEDALAGGRRHGILRREAKANVSLADALILATARRIGATLVTMDSRLANEAGTTLLL